MSQGSSAYDRTVSLHGERLLVPLWHHVDALSDVIAKDGALGLILIDASPILEIEHQYGARSLRRALEAFVDRLNGWIRRECQEHHWLTSPLLEEEQILLFLHRPRREDEFYTQELPRLAAELRRHVSVWLKRIVHPYLDRPPATPVGHGFILHRPFYRPESQIRRLVEIAEQAARFERERLRRDRITVLETLLLEEQISTVYQPVIRLADRSVIGYEALSRGPKGTELESPPALFGAAAEAGLEYEIDQLCRIRALHNAGGIAQGQKLFLNILPSSIHDPEFENARIRTTLGDLGLQPSDLVLEISERQAIGNFPIFREAIDYFTSLGFGIALDDIGAGFSSLEAALELSPDYLKIDISLVRGIEDDPQKQELLRGMRSLALKMNSIVVAEGVETVEQLAAVEELGITCAQGFLLGIPGPLPPAATDPPKPA